TAPLRRRRSARATRPSALARRDGTVVRLQPMSPRETEGTFTSFALSGLVGRIFVPPLVAFLLLSLYVVAEAIGYRGLARSEAETIAEAAALGHAARALQLIEEGQNPNQ